MWRSRSQTSFSPASTSSSSGKETTCFCAAEARAMRESCPCCHRQRLRRCSEACGEPKAGLSLQNKYLQGYTPLLLPRCLPVDITPKKAEKEWYAWVGAGWHAAGGQQQNVWAACGPQRSSRRAMRSPVTCTMAAERGYFQIPNRQLDQQQQSGRGDAPYPPAPHPPASPAQSTHLEAPQRPRVPSQTETPPSPPPFRSSPIVPPPSPADMYLSRWVVMDMKSEEVVWGWSATNHAQTEKKEAGALGESLGLRVTACMHTCK
eukprot:scaffold36596_cov16-Tisochrysis_lutea.AAC.2